MGNLDPIWAKIMEPHICLKRLLDDGAYYVDIRYGRRKR